MAVTKQALAAFLLPALLFGCSSIDHDGPGRVEALTIDFDATDLRTLAGEMVDSLIRSPALNYIEHSNGRADARIVILMSGIGNRTSERVDTTGITETMRVKLLNSGKFRFVVGDAGQSEVRFQQGSGRVDPEEARAFGERVGADAVLFGTLRSIDKEDLYYQLVLSCVNVESGEILWSDEARIRKTLARGSLVPTS